MKHKKLIVTVSILAFIILTIACLWKPLRLDRFGNVHIDWLDAIQYANESYIIVDPRTEISLENIGINIGKVHFILSGNVGNPHYKMRNFDATYLPKNTELFLIKDDSDSIAAFVDGVFYKYEKRKDATDNSVSPSQPVESSLSQTSDIEEIPTMSKELFEHIGIGTTANTVKHSAGVDLLSDPEKLLQKAIISGVGLATFDYSYGCYNSFVIKIQIVDNSGERTITPIPDSYPLEDFLMQKGVVTLKAQGEILEEDLDLFGTIVSDAIRTGYGGEAYGDFKERKIVFDKISFTLVQNGKYFLTNRWRIWEMSIRDTGYTNPRGLRVGLSLSETLQKINTGEFVYSISLDDGEISRLDIRKLPTHDYFNEYWGMSISFENNKISEIMIEFYSP